LQVQQSKVHQNVFAGIVCVSQMLQISQYIFYEQTHQHEYTSPYRNQLGL